MLEKPESKETWYKWGLRGNGGQQVRFSKKAGFTQAEIRSLLQGLTRYMKRFY